MVAAAGSLVAAVGLWLSRASFDLAGTAEYPIRVAMLPSMPELAGFVVLCALMVTALGWLLDWNPAIADVATPLFGLGLLALPYLPWLPDWFPALRLLAGPARWVVWVIVMGQMTRVFGLHLTRRWFSHGTIFTTGVVLVLLAIFCVSVGVYAYAIPRVTRSGDMSWAALLAGGTVAAAIWGTAFVLVRSTLAATFAWAAICLTVPFVLNGLNLGAGVLDSLTSIRHVVRADVRGLMVSVPALLFDQEFGIFPFAPVLMLSPIGVALMMWDRATRRAGIVIASAALIVVALAGLADPWWHRTTMPGGRILLLLPLFAPPLASLYSRSRTRPLLRASMYVLLFMSLGLTMLIVHGGAQVHFPEDGDGSSTLLQWISPTWNLWDHAPSYTSANLFAASVRSAAWLAAFGAAALLLSRTTRLSEGRAALRATAVMVIGPIAALTAITLLRFEGESQRFDPEGRVLLPFLETFDPIARPIALRYDPLSQVAAEDLVSLFGLAAVPQQRVDRQPLRVVLNARFRLAAGEYVVDFTGSEAAGTVPSPTVGLQIGREGMPLEIWPLALTPGGHAQRHFRVPLDAEFVGFRASRQVEATIAALRVAAIKVIPVRDRLRTPTVRSAASFPPITVFFHDADAYTESEGVWIKGRSAARMTVMNLREGDSSVALKMHGGARANTVRVATDDWSHRVDLLPGAHATVLVPSKAGVPFVPLTIAPAGGFVPAEVDGGDDRRLLGAWVAFSPGDSARMSEAP